MTNNYTKKDIEDLRNDPLLRFVSELAGVDHDKICDNALDDLAKKEEEKKVKDNKDYIEKIIEDFKKKYNDSLQSDTTDDLVEDDEDYNEDPSEFVLSEQQLDAFIKKYTALETKFKKLNTLFGLNFAGSESIYSAYNEIVWDLIEAIFGAENRDEIADFCFGNSNLDTVHDLYEELV